MFRFNDRVRLIVKSPTDIYRLAIKDEGTVVDFYNSVSGTPWVGIRFDKYMGGHSCNGKCDAGHGWYIPMEALEKVDKEDNATLCSDEGFLSFIYGGIQNG